MHDDRTPPERRFRVPCADVEEFRRRFAPVFARRGVFLASNSPEPVGTRVRLRLELEVPGPFVSGEAVVDRHARGKRHGAFLKFLQLDTGSLALEAPGGAPDAGADEDGPALAAQGDPPLDDGDLTPTVPLDLAVLAHGFSPPDAEPEREPCRESSDRPWEPEPRAPRPDLCSPARTEACTSVDSPRAQQKQRERETVPISRIETRPHAYREGELRGLRDPELWVGGLRPFDVLGNYQLLTRLGCGGMAEVYLARSTLGQGVEKLVAFKVVLPEFGPDTRYASLFLNEARISATLQHPNLIQVFGLGQAVARPYLAMEYVHGRTLGALMARLRENGRRPPLGFAALVAVELCKALEYVHGKRDLDGRPLDLVHRDVSPGNVLVSDQGEVKLVDFGVASDSSRVDELGGVAVGKAGYMSPEQSRGEQPRPGWDLFALGVLLQELIAACGPDDDSMDPTRLAQAQTLLARAVLWAQDPQPARRPPSAKAFRELVEQARDLLPPFSLAALVAEQFGDELALEQHRIEELIAHARRVAPPRRVTGTMPLLRPLRVVRRRLTSTRLFVQLWRRRRLFAALAAALLAGVLAAGVVGWRNLRRERELAGLIVQADAQLRAARLVSPAGDGALELLLQAKASRPDDERVAVRLEALADALEGLGRTAESRGNLAEAAVHYQGALAADPSRALLRQRLPKLEREVRARAAGKAAR